MTSHPIITNLQTSLPKGWSKHPSSSHPGHFYYYNQITGAKTWDSEDLVSINDNKALTVEREIVTDVRCLGIEELEKLLAEKKKSNKAAFREVGGKSVCSAVPVEGSRMIAEKRKLEPKEPMPLANKRQRIVFDMKEKDGQLFSGKEGRSKESSKIRRSDSDRERNVNSSREKDGLRDGLSRSKDKVDKVLDKKGNTNKAMKVNKSFEKEGSKASTSKANTSSPRHGNNNSVDKVDISSDGSLYGMDEDELLQLKKIKTKYKSPPKTPKKKNEKPLIAVSNTSSSPTKTPSPRYLPENYSCQYVNYQNQPKETYQRQYKPRVRDRPVLAKLEGQLSCQPLASSGARGTSGVEVVDLDRTPEQNLDVTPVYGSLEDSLEWGQGGFTVTAIGGNGGGMQADTPSMTLSQDVFGVTSVESELATVISDKTGEGDFSHGEREQTWGETSWEGERPPTPPLVQEMQEEESMEWESVDREEILKETHRVRDMISQAMDTQEGEEVEVEDEKFENEKVEDVAENKTLVVVDTNVFISSLSLVTHLRDDVCVKVIIPWMVVQEMDSLKTSPSRDTAVRARAAVRWLHSSLQSGHPGVVAQTLEQGRKASSLIQSNSADDRILACCLLLRDEGSQITLLTNDINLANKGMINGVKCGDSENIVSVLSGEEEGFVQQDLSQGPNEGKICSELIMQGENTTRDLLETVLRHEFILAYGEKLWEKIVSVKPKPCRPYWSLPNLFTMFSKHHIAVFGLVFPRNGQELKMRLEAVKGKLRNRVWKVLEVKVVLSEIANLFDIIKARDSYEGIVDICNDKLSDICSQLENYETVAAGDQIKKVLDDSVDDGQEIVKQIFQNVWEIIASFTRGFATALSVPNSLPKFEPDIQFKSCVDATRNLSGFFSVVSSLQETMVQVVASQGMQGSHLLQFYNLLTQFRANLEMDQSYWPPLGRAVTFIQLEMFLTREQNQDVVRGGLEQISDFRQILIKCISGDSHDM